MAREKEIKILLKISLDDFIKRIQGQGYRLLHTLKQKDIYFDTKGWYLYENLAALRLRQVDEIDHSFSFKKMFYLPEKEDKYYIEEIEIKIPFSKIDEFEKIFARLQLPYSQEVFKKGEDITHFLKRHKYYDEQIMSKSRKVYSDGNNEVTIDDVDKVGIIIELECAEDDPLFLVKSFLDDHEWNRSLEGTSYMWLKEIKGLTSHLSNLEKFKTEPDWNVWDNETEMYIEIQKD